MNNLVSYCGLVDARISASEKYLPVRMVTTQGISNFRKKLKIGTE